jgi:hypothetical protein
VSEHRRFPFVFWTLTAIAFGVPLAALYFFGLGQPSAQESAPPSASVAGTISQLPDMTQSEAFDVGADRLFVDLYKCSRLCGLPGATVSYDQLSADEIATYRVDEHSGCALGSHAIQRVADYTFFTVCGVRVALIGAVSSYSEGDHLRTGRYRYLGIRPFDQRNGFATKLPVIELIQ